MVRKGTSRIPEILRRHEQEILTEWVERQRSAVRPDLLSSEETREQSREFLRLVTEAAQSDNLKDVGSAPAWEKVRDLLVTVSESRGRLGFGPRETAAFVFSLKQPLFSRLQKSLAGEPEALAEETWTASELLDGLGLYTTEVYQRGRDAVISRQQQDMIELSTPVVQLWEGILALPLIGTLDSARTQVVMDSLLQRIVDTGSSLAIIDITGVPTVDTLVAQHLLKTVAAARLMGADCIISGIRPQIAQTIVHLGVALGDVTTRASLADAFAIALQRQGLAVVRTQAG